MRTVSEPEAGSPSADPSHPSATLTDVIAMPDVSPEARPGDRIGRYVVIRLLGSGGMGMVYLADDPRLDRRVAIKVLRGKPGLDSESERARQRLLREAQAIARLNHPNVVAVHDVGTHHDGIFIAMEYVEGVSLRRWLRDRERKLPQILDVFIGAARGLSAAHAANIVHRDVKPDNIVVDEQLRTRVLDFGLARSVSEASMHAEARASMESEDGDTYAIRPIDMTVAGHIMGTPPYMSPEQARGLPVTSKSDQYSLCVGLYEAIYGMRPFVGKSASELAAARKAGPRFPERPPIPRALRRIIERALAVDPEHRFASMDAIVRALTRVRHRGRRTTAWIVSASAASAALSFAGARWLERDDSCMAVVDLDSWNAKRRSALERTFVDMGSRLSRDSWPHIRQELDAFAKAWSAARRDACEATVVRGDQSGASMDLRLACLDRKRQPFDALVETFETADLMVVTRATQAVRQLPDLTECADLATLALLPPMPEADSVKTVEHVRGELAMVEARRHSGRYREAQALLDALAPTVAASEYLPLVAEYELQKAKLAHELGNRAAVETALNRALASAEEGHYLSMRVEALAELAFELGAMQKRFDAAEAVLGVAEAAALAMGDPPDVRVRRKFVQAEILFARDRFDEARIIYEGLATQPSRLIEHDVVLERLAATMRNDRRAAQETFRQVLSLREQRYGMHHPRVADALAGLGGRLMHDGAVDEARASFERALAIRKEAFGAESTGVAKIESSLGAVAIKAEDYPRAIEHLERAVDVATRDPEAVEFDTATILSNLGIVHSRLGNQEKARDLHRRALTTMERTDPEHPRRVIPVINIAASYARDAEHAQAIVWFEQAQEILLVEREFGRAGDMMVEIAEAHLALGQHEEAHTWLTKAIRSYERATSSGRLKRALSARLLLGDAALRGRRATAAVAAFEGLLEALQHPEDAEEEELVVRACLGLARSVSGSDRARTAEAARKGLAVLETLEPAQRTELGEVESELRRLAR
jgi:eukaryotic-like serine/threonine-protein kinase